MPPIDRHASPFVRRTLPAGHARASEAPAMRAGAGMSTAAAMALALALIVAGGLAVGSAAPQACGPALRAPSTWALLLLTVVAPVLEETALRHGLHAWLLTRLGSRRGPGGLSVCNHLCAVVFAVAHAGVASPALLPAYLLPAWLIGWIYERTGRLLPCIALHAAANAAALIACGARA